MSDAYHLSSDQAIEDAGLAGIGSKSAERLEEVGITRVCQLANADVAQLASDLADLDPRWKPETWHHRASEWIAAANAYEPRPRHATLSYVFLLTLSTDVDGHPIRARFECRSPDEAKAEKMSRETFGWSPLVFAQFVADCAGLTEAAELTEERRETELVEWSKHYVEGDLVRGGRPAAAIRAELPTGDLSGQEGRVRWRARGRLVPFGGGAESELGQCEGIVQPGENIELVFAFRPVPQGFYRAAFDVTVSPPAPPGTLLTVAGREPA